MECIQRHSLIKLHKTIPPTPIYHKFLRGANNGRGSRLYRAGSRMIKNKKVGDNMAKARRPSKAKIKESLIKQLETKGANVPHFIDLIFDYLELYDTKIKLQKDINERGVAYETTSANGYKIIKQNQSVKDVVAVEKQMLSMLREMGLTTDAPTGNDMIDEDL